MGRKKEWTHKRSRPKADQAVSSVSAVPALVDMINSLLERSLLSTMSVKTLMGTKKFTVYTQLVFLPSVVLLFVVTGCICVMKLVLFV